MFKNVLCVCSTFGAVTVVGLSLVVFAGGCGRHDTLRQLRKEEIRPALKRFTGKELPDHITDLRAFYRKEGFRGGREELFVAIRTDRNGCAAILDLLRTETPRESYHFPDEDGNPFMLGLRAIDRVYEFQSKLGVMLFDKTLVDRVYADALERANTGHYPIDAVTGHYLHFYRQSKAREEYYSVLIFADEGIVYIWAGQHPKGMKPPR